MGKASTNTLKILLLVMGLVHSLNVFAAYVIQSNEVMLPPPSCLRMSSTNFEPDAYKIVKTKRKGPALGPHMQHFCHGKKSLIRADRNFGTYLERNSLETAISEFNYVLSHTPKNGSYNNYLAITCVEKAKALRRLKKTSESLKMYQQAIKYNPKLTKAYAGISDLYKTLDMNDEAREILEQGLKRVPKSKSLQRRLDKL